MTPKERVFARLNGQDVDKIPNMNIVMLLAARELGVPYSEYCQDYRLLSQGNMLCAEKYGLDVLTVMSDPMREASALGADVVFPPDDVPYEKSQTITSAADLRKLHPVAPCDSRRMTGTIQAIEEYKKRCGDHYAVIGWVEGSLAEAADLRGINALFMDFYDEPEFVRDLMTLCFEQAVLYAKAQIEAGADIIGVGDAIASVAGPNIYEEFARPFEVKLLSAIKDMGAKTKLHICGNITPLLDRIPAHLCDIIDVDHMVPLDEARKKLGDEPALSGNYDPVAVMLQGNPASIDAAVRTCIGLDNGKYICAAGCEVPKFTPEQNFLQVHKTLTSL